MKNKICPTCHQEIKDWIPKIGEKFYYINRDFGIGSKRRDDKEGEDWAAGMFDDSQVKYGNFFKTEEGAKCCRDNFIKPAFKKYHEVQKSGGAEC